MSLAPHLENEDLIATGSKFFALHSQSFPANLPSQLHLCLLPRARFPKLLPSPLLAFSSLNRSLAGRKTLTKARELHLQSPTLTMPLPPHPWKSESFLLSTFACTLSKRLPILQLFGYVYLPFLHQGLFEAQMDPLYIPELNHCTRHTHVTSWKVIV